MPCEVSRLKAEHEKFKEWMPGMRVIMIGLPIGKEQGYDNEKPELYEIVSRHGSVMSIVKTAQIKKVWYQFWLKQKEKAEIKGVRLDIKDSHAPYKLFLVPSFKAEHLFL